MRFHRLVAGVVLTSVALPGPCPALDKPTGNPLVMSDIETEQPIPLAYLSPDGATASCSRVRLHWSPSPSTSSDDAASLTLDIPADQPGAATFTAQFWNASLAGSLAWQKPWQGAHWKVLETPATDGTGIDAALAVGMIATSARRPYPKDTLVIGNLHPDSSLGAVMRLADRLDAASRAGIARVIIPKVEQFETEADGTVVDIMSHAADLNLKCIPVDNIKEATEAVMNDPLPDPPTDSGPPKYNDDIGGYIDGYAQREQAEAASGLIDAPKEAQLDQYPPRQAADWRRVYAEIRQGQAAYKSGRFYVAYRLLARANSRMRGLNALTIDNAATFDVKDALSTSDQLQTQLRYLMSPPPIDRGELQSAMLIAEMADWAYDIQALLEGSELVTKQTFSQRTDATQAERDRARETILSANEEARYLLNGASFFTGLLPHLGDESSMPANSNAMNLLPQLIPAQLATAQIFADGLRPQADVLRVGLLFDPRLAAYVNVLREEKAQWDSRQRRRMNAPAVAPVATNSVADVTVGPADATPATNAPTDTNATSLVATNNSPVGFDPGNAYAPPHTEVEETGGDAAHKKLSDVAQCLIWVNTDCEIATLDQRYLRLAGSVDPTSHEWHAKDRSQLDALLQLASRGALEGAAFANEAEVSPALFAMILERANDLRENGDDADALAALRNYWRCALLGNMCWQLAHTHKAAAVDLGTTGTAKDADKQGKDKGAAAAGQPAAKDKTATAATTNAPPATATNTVETPAPAPAATNAAPENPPPAQPVASDDREPPVARPVMGDDHEPPVAKPVTIIPNGTDVPAVPPLEEPAPAAPAPAVAATNAPPATTPVIPAADVVKTAPIAVSANTNAAPVPMEPAYPRALPVDLSTNAPATAAPATTNAAPAPTDVIPVAPAAKDDEYTGGADAHTPPKALPVEIPATTNAAPTSP